MSKQDRQGARTASELVQRYNFGKSFAEVMGFATEAQEAAAEANASARAANEAVNGLDQEEIFNRLTNNGQAQGIYRDPNTGQLYINASYLATGVITSADGSVQIDLGNNALYIITKREDGSQDGVMQITSNGISVYSTNPVNNTRIQSLRISGCAFTNNGEGIFTAIQGIENHLQITAGSNKYLNVGNDNCVTTIRGSSVLIPSTLVIDGKIARWKDNGDGTYSLVGQ